MATYFGILTKVGEAKQANAMALGQQLKITELSVGDGGGTTPVPDPNQTALIGEWRRAPINQLYVHPDNPNYLVAEQVIPENEGGRWIREWGLWDADGDLIAVTNCPPTYKPQLAEGSGRTQVIRMVIMVASTDSFVLKIDPSIVLATRKYVDDGIVSLDATLRQYVTSLIKKYAPMYSITALPQADQGPIIVVECAEVWTWVQTPYYTGYRSPLCGRPVDGHTATPLPSEVDAVGGLLSKTAYARLWGYARENGLVVTQAAWSASIGAHYFVDADANNFRVPDLRNVFRRFAGTDADTGSARALGSRQAGAMQSHAHSLYDPGHVHGVNDPGHVHGVTDPGHQHDVGGWVAGSTGVGTLMGIGGGAGTSRNITGVSIQAHGTGIGIGLSGTGMSVYATGGTENRPVNAAYLPRIHV